MSDDEMDRAWRQDQETERRIRAALDAIEAVKQMPRFRRYEDHDTLELAADRLRRIKAHIVAVWD